MNLKTIIDEKYLYDFVPSNWNDLRRWRNPGLSKHKILENIMNLVLSGMGFPKREQCLLYTVEQNSPLLVYKAGRNSNHEYTIGYNELYLFDLVDNFIDNEEYEKKCGDISIRASLDAFALLVHECVHIMQNYRTKNKIIVERDQSVLLCDLVRHPASLSALKANSEKKIKNFNHKGRKRRCLPYLYDIGYKANSRHQAKIFHAIYQLQPSEREAYEASVTAANLLIDFLKNNDPEHEKYLDQMKQYRDENYDICTAKKLLQEEYDCDCIDVCIDACIMKIGGKMDFLNPNIQKVPEILMDLIVYIAENSVNAY